MKAFVNRRISLLGSITTGVVLISIPIWEHSRSYLFVIQHQGEYMSILLLGGILIFLMYLLGMLVFDWRHLSTGGPRPGIYERGVEVPWDKFIPFGEVMGIERGSHRLWKVMVLRLRPSGRHVTLGREIFGVKGWDVMESILWSAYMTDVKREPPRLVVYPHRDDFAASSEQGPGG